MSFDFKEKTLGIIGVGNVGGKVARLAALLGFRILLCDPPRARKEGEGGFVDIDEIISQSDIITCHVPLIREGLDATYHLFDSARLESMRADQILINTSRGEVIDSSALKVALKNKRIKAASLDVWENEPQIDKELPTLLYTGTPHIAGYSLDGKAMGTTMCVQGLADFFGLGCRNWEVTDIPLPAEPVEFTIDAGGRKPRQVLAEAILRTYDIMQDDKALRNNIKDFEKLRSHYPVRREFHAYSVHILNDNTGMATAFLREAGFNIIS